MVDIDAACKKLGAYLAKPRVLRWRDSLSFRLFIITIASILVIEALIFVPSATRFRHDWLQDQVEAGRLAALALKAAPSRMVSEELAAELLDSAMVLSVAELSQDRRERILDPQSEICCHPHIILMPTSPRLSDVWATLGTYFARDDRFLILRAAGAEPGRVIEVVVSEMALKRELNQFGLNILGMSLIISILTGAAIYMMLLLTVVRPVRRVTLSVEQFRKDPGGWKRRLSPTPRRDEIGRAQNALSAMEEAVSDSFRQRERLAQLGEAVAKINHDLRNSLATAQLVSDGLSRSEDPRVTRTLPRLERALERAINLASDTLKYGRSSAPDAKLQLLNLSDMMAEAATEALAQHTEITFLNKVDAAVTALADADHLHRICANLIRNSAEAQNGKGVISVSYDGTVVSIADTGPGLPDKAKQNLFKPFAGSTRRDGTGLGLALSRDLARAMGGDLELAATGARGTRFALRLPSGTADETV